MQEFENLKTQKWGYSHSYIIYTELYENHPPRSKFIEGHIQGMRSSISPSFTEHGKTRWACVKIRFPLTGWLAD
jgi:hypothetical protein